MGVQDFRKERIRDIVRRELEVLQKTDNFKNRKFDKVTVDVEAEKQNRYLYSLCKIANVYGMYRAQIMDMNLSMQERDKRLAELKPLQELGAKLTERLENSIANNQQVKDEYGIFVDAGKRLFKGPSSVNIRDIFNKTKNDLIQAQDKLKAHFEEFDKPTNAQDRSKLLQPAEMCDVANQYARNLVLLKNMIGPSARELNLDLGQDYNRLAQQIKQDQKDLGISAKITPAGMLTKMEHKYQDKHLICSIKCLTNAAKNQQVIELSDKKGMVVSGIKTHNAVKFADRIEISALLQDTKIAYNPNASRLEQKMQMASCAGKELSKFTQPAEKASFKIIEAMLNPATASQTAANISEDVMKQFGNNVQVTFDAKDVDSHKVTMSLSDFYNLAKGEVGVKDAVSMVDSDHRKQRFLKPLKDIASKSHKFFKDALSAPITCMGKHLAESLNTCRNIDSLQDFERDLEFEKSVHEKICEVQKQDLNGNVTLIDRVNLELITASARSTEQYIEKMTKDDVEVQDIGSR